MQKEDKGVSRRKIKYFLKYVFFALAEKDDQAA